MKKKLTIGLISHLVHDYNLGCSALAISNIALMDEVFKAYDTEVEYVVLLPEPKGISDIDTYTSLEGITSNKYSYKTFPRLKPILKKPWLIKKVTAFDDCDFVVNLCGGDGYTDIYGMIRLLAESVPVYIAKSKKIPMLFAPQTIGPFNKTTGRIIAKHTLKKLDHLFVRDKSSFDCCSNLKLDKITTQVIDVAFALPFEKKTTESSKIKVGINVSGLLYNRDNYFNLSFSYKEFIDKIIKKMLSQGNYEVHLIPHVISETVPTDDDYRVCKEISEKYPDVTLAPKFDSPIDAKNYISAMDVFSGARMHSTIGAISSGVPVIPVAYSRKFNGLYGTLEYPYMIDAKADITCYEAVNQFFEYVERRDEMHNSVNRAREVYTEGLQKYKNEIANCFHLLD